MSDRDVVIMGLQRGMTETQAARLLLPPRLVARSYYESVQDDALEYL